jgi:hypothetical protein
VVPPNIEALSAREAPGETGLDPEGKEVVLDVVVVEFDEWTVEAVEMTVVIGVVVRGLTPCGSAWELVEVGAMLRDGIWDDPNEGAVIVLKKEVECRWELLVEGLLGAAAGTATAAEGVDTLPWYKDCVEVAVEFDDDDEEDDDDADDADDAEVVPIPNKEDV